MMLLNPGVPVVMFHALLYGGDDPFYLGFPEEYLDRAIRRMLEDGLRFVTVRDIVRGTATEDSVCLTFDDGFEDNYHLLLPLLKRHGVPCTVFLSTDFVREREGSREPPSLGSRWVRSFLTREQVLEMAGSGLVDFQGHAATHTWHPTSGRVLSVHPPEDIEERYWVYWNRHPEGKADPDPSRMLAAYPRGFFLTEHERSLACRRFLPAREPGDVGGISPGDVLPGRLETGEERRERYRRELVTSREELSELLGREVCFLCWPGGAMDDLAWETYLEAGYEACSLPSSRPKRERAARLMGPEARVVARMSSSTRCRGVDLGPRELVRRVAQERAGSSAARLGCRLARRLAWARRVLGGGREAER